MKKQNSKLRLAKKVISIVKTEAIKGGLYPSNRTNPSITQSKDNC